MPPKAKKQKVEGAVWEWLDDDNSWTAYDPADSLLLETAFTQGKSALKTADLTFNKGFSTKYAFDLVAMTQVNEDSSKARQLRRVPPAGEYQWEWRDDAGVFVPFYDDDCALLQRLCDQVGVGTGKEAKTKALSFNKGFDSVYTFTFAHGAHKEGTIPPLVGVQTNKDSGTVRDIRRVPKKGSWEAKGYGIAALAPPVVTAATVAVTPSSPPTSPALKAASGAVTPSSPSKPPTAGPAATVVGPLPLGGTDLRMPAFWSGAKAPVSAATHTQFSLVDVPATSDEAKAVASWFEASFTSPVSVTLVQRVENPVLWTFYALSRAHIASRNGGDPNERRLYFGEHSAPNMNLICKLGFDTRVASDGSYGQGLYYSTTAKSVDPKCHKTDAKGSKSMFVVRCSCGSIADGKQGFRRPPPKDPKKPSGDLFDSCADNKGTPTTHVFFANAQMYPEYIVNYRAT